MILSLQFNKTTEVKPVKLLLAMRALALVATAWLFGACAGIESTPGVRNTSRTFTTVVLDAGHGGHDSGARIRKGALEKDLALDVVLRLAPKLREAGFRTVLTRKSDVFIPLDGRVDISNARENAVFVSVHFNDAGRKPVVGVESYYFSSESSRMAERMVRVLSQTTGAPNRGARTARFRVIRMNANPAVLMECGYLTTSKEAAWISRAEYRERIAVGLARGIIEQRGGPIRQESPVQIPQVLP
jgi:N-acetylmuramoyl-L-alanine amidase